MENANLFFSTYFFSYFETRFPINSSRLFLNGFIKEYSGWAKISYSEYSNITVIFFCDWLFHKCMMQLASLQYEVKPHSGRALEVREVKCSTVLRRMNFSHVSEYTANFYRGCTHGCVYCYAPSLIHDERRWGYFVDAKANSPQLLRKELGQIHEKEVVFLSSASDPYQPVEARFKITRRCLEALLERDFPVIILTRSPLVLRDTDLLKKFTWLRVGCSISSVSNKFYEPGVVSVSRRIETLRRLHEHGITTWVSMAPVIPQLVLEDVGMLLKKLKKSGVSCVVFGMLRFIGYEESRIMFEQRTNLRSASVMRKEKEVREEIAKLVSSNGLDSYSVLEWSREPTKTLDDFSPISQA